ncbi:MAG: cytochrome c biogenesis protein CcdA [Candidatus Bathyarchaeota archaeon]
MDIASLSLSFTAGFLATLAPCALPMVPGYVAYYMNLGQGKRSPLTYLGFALATAAGFTSMYLLVGVLPAFGVSRLAERLYAVTPFIGAFLVIIGLVTAFSDVFSRVPVFKPEATKTVGYRGLLLYGAGYGVASMACSLPVFILLVLQSASSGGLTAILASFMAYGLGAATMMVPLTFAVAYSNHVLLERFMSLLPHVKKVSALVLVAAGLYMIAVNL